MTMPGITFPPIYPPPAITLRYCPTAPTDHWRVEGPTCPDCRAGIISTVYTPPKPPSVPTDVPLRDRVAQELHRIESAERRCARSWRYFLPRADAVIKLTSEVPR